MKYNVVITTHANGTVEVEADSPEEAAEMVRNGDADFPTLCHQCTGYSRKNSLELGDEWEVVVEKDSTLAVYEVDE